MPEENTLSPREQEILQLAAKGLTNREIAQTLSISPNTVKVHLSNIFEKAGVASRTEAALYGMEHGIVAVPGGEAEEQAPQFSLRETLQKYRWVWVAMMLLLAVSIVTFTTNIILPAQTPEPRIMEDVAERWQEWAPLPETRSGMAAEVYNGHIYSLAGMGPEGLGEEGFRYSPEEDRWEEIKAKPTPVSDVQGVLIGEKIYVPGGRLANGQPTDILEIYNPREDVWGMGALLPRPICAYALADFEGQLYLFGGWDGQRALDNVYIYDPIEDNWREGTQMPIARQDAGAVALTDKIIVLGGRNNSDILKDAQAYFPSRDSGGEDPWSKYVALPEGRYDFGVANIYDNIYILGGKPMGKSNQMVGWLLLDEEWITFPAIQNFNGRDTTLVSLDSLLVLFDSQIDITTTPVWTYQAFYYSIYIPFVP
ncbi:MAG: LuxR C-terminal-related transcriptional regulator [Chloroflexota bacterium]|nr:LuxR C-terminal-related transcriptional regulator [Chloroflexota bacterium]